MIQFGSLLSNPGLLSSIFLEEKNFIELTSREGKNLFHSFTEKNFNACLESYAFSLGYYLITGRKGAWLKGNKNFIMIVCRHPNIDGEFLYFAPKYDKVKIIEFARELNIPNLKISRLSSSILDFEQKEEDIMDWIYPSHTFSTQEIQTLEGHKYSRIRWELTKFKNHSIEFIPNTMPDPKSLMSLLRRQANALAQTQKLSEDEIFNSLIEGIRVYEQNKDCMNIGVFYKDKIPFSLVIWDKTLSSHANLLWLIHDVTINSIGYCIYHRFGSFLYDYSIQYLNTGGSETKGLNDFKLKFRPVQSFSCSNLLIDVSQEKKIAA